MQALRISIAAMTKAPIRVFFGYDFKDELLRMKQANEPFLYLDHAYFDRGYDKLNFRAIYSGIHQTNILNVDDNRRKKFNIKLKDWKNGSKILLIPAAKNPLDYHNEQGWNEKVVKELMGLTKREILVKAKKTNGLGDALNDVYCLVSHTSVAAVESVINGVPVAVSVHNPAYQVGTDVSKVNNPVTPDRENWLNSLSYSQFTLEELKSGTAWQIIKEVNRL